MLNFLHRSLQFLLMVCKQRVNLAVRFVANCVDLRSKVFPRSCRILVEQGLNLVLVFLEQRPHLLLLFRVSSRSLVR